MSEFIQRLFEAIKAETAVILSVLGAAAGAAIGSAVGGTVGTAIGGPVGTIIGIAAGMALGALVGWIVYILQDDIFAPASSTIRLPSANSTFEGGRLVSPKMRFHYRDHGWTLLPGDLRLGDHKVMITRFEAHNGKPSVVTNSAKSQESTRAK